MPASYLQVRYTLFCGYHANNAHFDEISKLVVMRVILENLISNLEKIEMHTHLSNLYQYIDVREIIFFQYLSVIYKKLALIIKI